MRAVVLVGGFGTRLRPLTLRVPKQMLPVVDRPMIERVVGHLAGHGVEQAVLSLGYRPDAFLEAYPDNTSAGVALHYTVEPEPLDTAGAIRYAVLDAGIDDTFVVVNGDVLTDFDVGKLWARHGEAGAEGTIHLTPVDDPSRYGVVPTDDRGRVEAFIEKPSREDAPSHWINAGTYVLEPSVVDRIPGEGKVSIERETFPAMVEDGTLYAVESPEYWIDAGTPATYLEAQLDLIDGKRGDPPDAVHRDAVVSSSAEIERSVVMEGATIGDDVVLKGTAVLPGATVREGAEVRDSRCVGPRAVVGAGASVSELSVLGDAVTVADGARVVAERVPEPTR